MRLDDRSISDFSRLYVGRRCDSEHLAPLFECEFGLPSDDTSRLLLMTALDADARLRTASVFGMSRVAEQLRERLACLRLECGVRSIAADGRGVELRSGERLKADAVISAVSPSGTRALAKRLLPGERAFFEEARRRERVDVVVAVSERAASPPHWLREGPLAAIVDATPPGHPGPGGLVRLISRSDRDDAELTERLLVRARRERPALNRTVEATLVCRPTATEHFGIGHYRRIAALRRAAHDAPERPLFFAGAAFVAPHAEGVVQSAERTAAEVLERLSA